jgi:hypothetical protein
MTHRRRHQSAFAGYRLQGTIRHSCRLRKPAIVAVPEVIEGKRVTGRPARCAPATS